MHCNTFNKYCHHDDQYKVVYVTVKGGSASSSEHSCTAAGLSETAFAKKQLNLAHQSAVIALSEARVTTAGLDTKQLHLRTC